MTFVLEPPIALAGESLDPDGQSLGAGPSRYSLQHDSLGNSPDPKGKGKGKQREMEADLVDHVADVSRQERTISVRDYAPTTPKQQPPTLAPESPLLRANSSSSRLSASPSLGINSSSPDLPSITMDIGASLISFPAPPVSLPSPQSSLHSARPLLSPGAARNTITSHRPQIRTIEHQHHSRQASIQSITSLRTRQSSLEDLKAKDLDAVFPATPPRQSSGVREKSRVSMDTPRGPPITPVSQASPPRSPQVAFLGSLYARQIASIPERASSSTPQLSLSQAGSASLADNARKTSLHARYPSWSTLEAQIDQDPLSSPRPSRPLIPPRGHAGTSSMDPASSSDMALRSTPGIVGIGEGWASGPEPGTRRRSWLGFPSRKGKEKAADQDPLSLWNVPEDKRASVFKQAWNRSLSRLPGGTPSPPSATRRAEKSAGPPARQSLAARAKDFISRSRADVIEHEPHGRRGSEPILNTRTGELFRLSNDAGPSSARGPLYTQPLNDTTAYRASHARSQSELISSCSSPTKVGSRTSSFRAPSPNPTLVPGVSRHPAGYSRRYAASQPHLPTARTTSLIIPTSERDEEAERPMSISQQLSGGGLMPPWRPSPLLNGVPVTPPMPEIEEVPRAEQQEELVAEDSASESWSRRASTVLISSSGASTPNISETPSVVVERPDPGPSHRQAAKSNRSAVILGGRLKRTSTFGNGADDIAVEQGLLDAIDNSAPEVEQSAVNASGSRHTPPLSLAQNLLPTRPEPKTRKDKLLLGKIRAKLSSITKGRRSSSKGKETATIPEESAEVPVPERKESSGTFGTSAEPPLEQSNESTPGSARTAPEGRTHRPDPIPLSRPRPVSMIPLAAPASDIAAEGDQHARSASLDFTRLEQAAATPRPETAGQSKVKRSSWIAILGRSGTSRSRLSKLSEEEGSLDRAGHGSPAVDLNGGPSHTRHSELAEDKPSANTGTLRATFRRAIRRSRHPVEVSVASKKPTEGGEQEAQWRRRSFAKSVPALNRWSASEFNLLRFSFPNGEGTLDGVAGHFRRGSSRGSATPASGPHASTTPPIPVSEDEQRQRALGETASALFGRPTPLPTPTEETNATELFSSEGTSAGGHMDSADTATQNSASAPNGDLAEFVEPPPQLIQSGASGTTSGSTPRASPTLVTPVKPSVAEVRVICPTPVMQSREESNETVPTLHTLRPYSMRERSRPSSPARSSNIVLGEEIDQGHSTGRGVSPKPFAWAARPGLAPRTGSYGSNKSARTSRSGRSGETQFYSAVSSPQPSPLVSVPPRGSSTHSGPPIIVPPRASSTLPPASSPLTPHAMDTALEPEGWKGQVVHARRGSALSAETALTTDTSGGETMEEAVEASAVRAFIPEMQRKGSLIPADGLAR